MTLPLTRVPCGDAGHDASPPGSPRPPWWRAGCTSWRERGRRWLEYGRLIQERARRWRALATTPGGAAILLAASAVFACTVALFSTNPPERLWGLLAAGPYAVAAIAALAGRPGTRIAVAVSLAGALIVPLAWMAWSGLGQPEVSVVIRSAGLFLHNGTPYQGAHAVATAHDPYVYNPYLPALAVFGLPHALVGSGLITDRGCGSGWCSCSGSLARWPSAGCHGHGCGPQ